MLDRANNRTGQRGDALNKDRIGKKEASPPAEKVIKTDTTAVTDLETHTRTVKTSNKVSLIILCLCKCAKGLPAHAHNVRY